MTAETMTRTPIVTQPDFDALSSDALERMGDAGAEVVEVVRVLAKSNLNVVGEIIKDHGTFYEWDHYPPGDIFDPASHSQFYYHAHPATERPGEHGHFHTFVRPKGFPQGVRPAPLPDYEPLCDPDDELSHIVGISMDKYGVPIRLFTVNRWVTNEVWYKASDVERLVDCFEIDLATPSWPVNRWITFMVRLFRPQIVELIHARDARIETLREDYPDQDPYKVKDVEVLSYADIDIDSQIQGVARALEARRAR